MNPSAQTKPGRISVLPEWFRQPLPDMDKIRRMKQDFRAAGLHTVCESARCPNIGQCWGQGVATFMILGEICTRACRFCAVKAGRPMEVDTGEPRKVAEAVRDLRLRYVVITSVARDDIPDEGAEHFYQTIGAIRELSPQTRIEVLIPDFSNKTASIRRLIEARPEVVSHNIESVRRVSKEIRPQAQYDRSLAVLRNFKDMDAALFTKSSFMVGFGETHDEIEEVMRDLLSAGVDILTIGQYLQPTQLKRHLPVEKFYTPQEFDFYKQFGLQLGFKHVMSGPLVRSSYIAEEGYKECFAKSG
ncbi:MAG: lipoyl synthase [Candidatus Omnitrophica bacterium]|nr:lipoyl synthase [Candidatus Omnitrophota bacterium]MCB9719447.1 lipoyl synthase [Candidatus Omnitrophota bacterium]